MQQLLTLDAETRYLNCNGLALLGIDSVAYKRMDTGINNMGTGEGITGGFALKNSIDHCGFSGQRKGFFRSKPRNLLAPVFPRLA
jgi:hypothetical protein